MGDLTPILLFFDQEVLFEAMQLLPAETLNCVVSTLFRF